MDFNLVIVFFAIFLFFFYLKNTGKTKQNYSLVLEKIQEFNLELEHLLNYDYYFSNYKKVKLKNKYKETYSSVKDSIKYLHLKERERVIINNFKITFSSLDKKVDQYNTKYILKEKENYQDLFNSLEKYPLSDDQQTAIITDDDNNLVIAGAGTGKTTTIAGKVAYILKKKLAEPNEILVISYTNAAVNEMGMRIRNYLKDDDVTNKIKIKTFNSYGYEVNRTIRINESLKVAFENEDTERAQIQKTFDHLFLNNADFCRKAVNFLAFFNRPPRDDFEFESSDAYYKYEKSFKNVALNGEVFKSKEEVEIANFLFLNSVNFIYEYTFPLNLEDKNPVYGDYKPDFYLPDYNIYIEHYGIDREGNVPKRFKDTAQYSARERYHLGMEWKDKIHDKYKTTLIKTFSYENKENILIKKLKEKLIAQKVILKPRDTKEILTNIKKQETYEDFTKLISTFLSLMKSNGKQPKDILYKDDLRLKVFIDVFKPIYEEYEKYLKYNSLLDFNDMINHAAISIHNNQHKHGFKYILIDEFQDMSLSRYKLMKAFQKQNPEIKIYAVGDDWQSIFRFSGSDISLMTEFKKYFGYTKTINIVHTYRFNTEILKTTSEFIQKNSAQLRKELKALTEPEKPSFEFVPFDVIILDKNERKSFIHDKIQQVLEEVIIKGKEQSVFLIGRYNHDNPGFPDTYKNIDVTFYTAHSVKGLTCDYAILLNVNSGIFGFPSEIVDDPILEYLLYEGDHFNNAEERRLFYVATTRARHKNYIFYDSFKESKFVYELKSDLKYLEEGNNAVICPRCSGRMVKRRGRRGDFFGCSNYPNCKSIINV